MSIFSKSPAPEDSGPIPCLPFDTQKRYDIYVTRVSEDRLYSNVRIVALRFMQPSDGGYSIDALIEIEAANGVRALLPRLHVDWMCEHGTEPIHTSIPRVRPGASKD